jgi:hypothetical protein
MECWNIGILEEWNNEKKENWNVGTLEYWGRAHPLSSCFFSIIPSFHYSIFPLW